jgi:hypothetical protein
MGPSNSRQQLRSKERKSPRESIIKRRGAGRSREGPDSEKLRGIGGKGILKIELVSAKPAGRGEASADGPRAGLERERGCNGSRRGRIWGEGRGLPLSRGSSSKRPFMHSHVSAIAPSHPPPPPILLSTQVRPPNRRGPVRAAVQ